MGFPPEDGLRKANWYSNAGRSFIRILFIPVLLYGALLKSSLQAVLLLVENCPDSGYMIKKILIVN